LFVERSAAQAEYGDGIHVGVGRINDQLCAAGGFKPSVTLLYGLLVKSRSFDPRVSGSLGRFGKDKSATGSIQLLLAANEAAH
jgi:hypothetical protein